MTLFKRWTAILLALCLALVLVACAGDGGDGSTQQADSSAPEAGSDSSDAGTPPPESTPEPPADPQPAAGRQQPSSPQMPAEGTDPLTGLEAAEGMLPGQRPVAVMVRNSVRALPQRGLGGFQAAVEMPLEDGTTNLMLLFSDLRTVPDTGPVTEMQDQFLQMALPVQAIPAHIGASQYARNLLTVLDYKSLDGQYVGTTAFWYDRERTLPKPGGLMHESCWFTNADTLWAGMTAIDVVTVGEVPLLFNFEVDSPAPAGDAVRVKVQYSGSTTVDFSYNDEKGTYSDKLNGEKHVGADEQRARYKNLFLLETEIGLKADSQLLEFDFSGGTGWYFVDGNAIPVSWLKGGPTQQLTLYDEQGQPLAVAPGVSYIGFVPKGETPAVTWTGADDEG